MTDAQKLEIVITTEMVAAILDQIADDCEGREKIAAEIITERYRQDVEWGGPEHDDEHCGWDWCRFIAKQNDLADAKARTGQGEGTWRGRMVKIAALAFAAIESHDRVVGPDQPGEEL